MDAMNKWWIYNVLVLKIIKFLFKHRQSIGKVKLCCNVAGLLRKVYRGIAADYFRKSLLIGHFRITVWPLLQSESWTGAHPFIWKFNSFTYKLKLIFIWKDQNQYLLWKFWGVPKLAISVFVLFSSRVWNAGPERTRCKLKSCCN